VPGNIHRQVIIKLKREQKATSCHPAWLIVSHQAPYTKTICAWITIECAGYGQSETTGGDVFSDNYFPPLCAAHPPGSCSPFSDGRHPLRHDAASTNGCGSRACGLEFDGTLEYAAIRIGVGREPLWTITVPRSGSRATRLTLSRNCSRPDDTVARAGPANRNALWATPLS